MKPTGKSRYDSLYFDYPQFTSAEGSARDRLTDPVGVAIVGAGPVGMTAALSLARQGVASVLFDNKPTFNDGSRAICVSRSSFQIFDALGIVDPFLKKALGWTMGRTFYRGKQILEFEMPDRADEKFRPMYNIQQQFIEQYLWQAVADNPLIETRWQSEVTDLDHDDSGVWLTVADATASYRVKADWMLACDGAHSRVRRRLGHRLKGENYEGRYVIADVQMDHDYPTIRRALFDPDCRRGGTVLVHKQPDNIWRIDYQLGDDEDADMALDEAQVRRSVEAVLREIGHDGPWEIEWWSMYSANTLALEDYRDRQVFFVGDSAHIVPIFGVRGLNNGLADAANIGWKLAMVITGQAGDALLNSYCPERRGATLDVFENASKAARFMTPSSYGWRLMRDAALSLALDHDFAGQLANPRQFTPHVYDNDCAIVMSGNPDQTGLQAGELLTDCRVDNGFLLEQLGTQFTLICFDADMAIAVDQLDLMGMAVRHFETSSAVANHLKASKDTALVVRPDGYIGARWQAATAQTVQTIFRQLTCSEAIA